MFWPASLGIYLASQEGSGELKVLCCHPPSITSSDMITDRTLMFLSRKSSKTGER